VEVQLDPQAGLAYSSTRHGMHDPLAPLLADGVIDEILTRLKSGKEADLWLVRHGQEIVAAKVYKERLTRSFKNDAAYREGRTVRNSRTARAMEKGSRFGQQASEEAWKAKEADALHALHAAGVRVPRPVIFYEGVLLMELVLDPFGHPAPRLIDAQVTIEHAAPLYEDLRSQAVKILCCDLIHGDLSPYNVLAGRDGPVVIDFPQVIGASHNSQAERFFQRDLDNLRRFFEPIDPSLRARAGDAREIWRAYERRELTPDFVPTGRQVEGPRHGRPEHDRTDHGRPPRDRPDHGRPDHGRTEHGRPPRDRPAEQGRSRDQQPQGGRPPPPAPVAGRPPEARPQATRPESGRPRENRPPTGRPEHGRPPESRPPAAPPPHGPRPEHRDRQDRQDRRDQRGGRERQDRRDQRERTAPARPPLGAGHATPPSHPPHGSTSPAAARQGSAPVQRPPAPARGGGGGGGRPPDRSSRREPSPPEVVRLERPPTPPSGGGASPHPPRQPGAPRPDGQGGRRGRGGRRR
jgi:RIO kinase 1